MLSNASVIVACIFLLAMDFTISYLQYAKLTPLSCRRIQINLPKKRSVSAHVVSARMNSKDWILPETFTPISILSHDDSLTDSEKLKFARNGFIKLSKLFKKDVLEPDIRAESIQIFEANKLNVRRSFYSPTET